MAKNLFILNEAPYGSERSYNALRVASALARAPAEEIKMFLLGDAAGCAKSGQKVPEGFYNIEIMMGKVTRTGAEVGVCGTCLDARGISEAELMEGTRRASMADLASWTQWAEKVLVF